MSHLAMLSSTHSSYCNAIKSLAALYIVRGYLMDLINFWLKNNIQERWEKRLNDTRPHDNGVLILKSEFNTAWNYFSAIELGSTILGFWRDWLQHAEESAYNMHFPQYTSDTADLSEMRQELTTPVVAADIVIQLLTYVN
jgi:hypothetical protein